MKYILVSTFVNIDSDNITNYLGKDFKFKSLNYTKKLLIAKASALSVCLTGFDGEANHEYWYLLANETMTIIVPDDYRFTAMDVFGHYLIDSIPWILSSGDGEISARFSSRCKGSVAFDFSTQNRDS